MAATGAEFNQTEAITLDAAGNIYIADTGNQRIRKLDAATGIVTTVAGNGKPSPTGDGKGTYSGDAGQAANAGLSLPYAVAFDAAGNMYIPDSATIAFAGWTPRASSPQLPEPELRAFQATAAWRPRRS